MLLCPSKEKHCLMLLPSLAIRDALKLQNPAQKIRWATEQLIGSLFLTPVILANPTLGIPAKAATKGCVPQMLPLMEKQSIWENGNHPECLLWLPFDPCQYYRGVPMQKCILPLSTDIVQTSTYTPSATTPASDVSTATTIEQYIYEQAQACIAINPTYNFTNMFFEQWYSTDYEYKIYPIVKLRIVLNRDLDYSGSDHYGAFSVWDGN
jgi:hypothetical protein